MKSTKRTTTGITVTRYRQRTLRAMITYLQNEGPTSARGLAKDLGKEVRVITNYLHHFNKTFECTGTGIGAKWSTTVSVVQRGYDPDHRTR